MKKFIFLILIFRTLTSIHAQTKPEEPCCNIAVLDIKKNIVVARDILLADFTSSKQML